MLLDNQSSRREHDFNGWYEVKKNPLSREGVFQYLGRSVPGCGFSDDEIVNVYRPAEELSDPETLESFRLLPWVDEHAMLGPQDSGYIGAEEKGIHGVIGEELYFEDGVLYGNIKVFSNQLAELIDGGKRELSAGYRCRYEKSSGVYKGQRYDAIQRTIRGNHLALVEAGRMGPDVAVLDQLKFTFDARDAMADEKEKGAEGAGEKAEMTMAEATKVLGEILPMMAKMQEQLNAMAPKDPATDPSIAGEDEDDKDEKEPKDKGEDKDDEKDGDKSKKGEGMDKKEFTAALDARDKQIKALSGQIETFQKEGLKSMLGEITQRDTLARRLAPFIGAFDHSDKTLSEVAAYGIEKLGLKCVKGQEAVALDGYLYNRPAPQDEDVFAMDASGSGSDGDKLGSFFATAGNA